MDPKSPQNGPRRLIQRRPAMDPEAAKAWLQANFGPMTGPPEPASARSDELAREERREDLAALDRSLPTGYQWARLDTPELATLVGSAAREAVDDAVWRCRKLVFVGGAGAGKTSLAVACLRRWAAEFGRGASFFHAYALGVARIQHPAGQGEADLAAHAMRCRLALIDDLGSERSIAGCAVPDVIFERHAEDRPLWVTTGLTRPQLVQRYGDGIVRRVFEHARVIELQRRAAK